MVEQDSAFQWETEALRSPPPEPTGTETARGPASGEDAEVRDEPAAQNPQGQIPPGTMLVPLDAWNKMVMQLGNLHEAGQQLADARERAAKAETELRFIKERLAEMRAKAEAEAAEAAREPTPSPAQPMLGRIYHAWRRRRGRDRR